MQEMCPKREAVWNGELAVYSQKGMRESHYPAKYNKCARDSLCLDIMMHS